MYPVIDTSGTRDCAKSSLHVSTRFPPKPTALAYSMNSTELTTSGSSCQEGSTDSAYLTIDARGALHEAVQQIPYPAIAYCMCPAYNSTSALALSNDVAQKTNIALLQTCKHANLQYREIYNSHPQETQIKQQTTTSSFNPPANSQHILLSSPRYRPVGA